MARPKKDNADYFSHDADMRNDNRIKAVRRKFKNEGYAVWNMLLEHLTDCNFFEYEYNDLNIELLSGDFDIDPKLLKEMIDYFILLNLLIVEDGYIKSLQLIKRFESLLSKRKRDNKRVIVSENPQSKVKESKVKESKEDKTINNSEFIKKCLDDKQWVEVTSINNKIKIGGINKILTTFENNLISKGNQHSNIKEFKNHFINWLNLNPVAKPKQKQRHTF